MSVTLDNSKAVMYLTGTERLGMSTQWAKVERQVAIHFRWQNAAAYFTLESMPTTAV